MRDSITYIINTDIPYDYTQYLGNVSTALPLLAYFRLVGVVLGCQYIYPNHDIYLSCEELLGFPLEPAQVSIVTQSTYSVNPTGNCCGGGTVK
jgi:hypothetical protein